MKEILLKYDAAKSVYNGHPWVFSSGIKEKDKLNLKEGEIVKLKDQNNKFIGYACASPLSSIVFRIMERNENIIPDERWIENKIISAINFRKKINISSTAKRLIFSESDSLPGLIVDQYDKTLVCQFHTHWAEKNKNFILETLIKFTESEAIIEKNSSDIRKAEHLPVLETQVLRGKIKEALIIKENELMFYVHPLDGQKTGWYIDQRENRKIISSYSENLEVLDCFSFTGGFAVNCLKAKAKKVIRLDSSQGALDIGTENIKLNGFSPELSPYICGNAFEELRKMRDKGLFFDLIILDPPGLSPSRSSLPKAMRAIKDLNMLGLKLLKPDGLLAVFSCSSALSREELLLTLEWASKDTSREIIIIKEMHLPEDHPRLPSFKEGDYLKGFLCKTIS